MVFLQKKSNKKMKVLWFNLSCPSNYDTDDNRVLGGWQDSLEAIVKNMREIELMVAFKGKGGEKTVDGVKYIPIDISYNKYEKIKSCFSWSIESEKLLEESVRIVEKYHPDIIHVFGTEWPFGLIAEKTRIPVVVHMQGSARPNSNVKYSPGYNFSTYFLAMKGNLARYVWYGIQSIKQKTRVDMEKRIYNCVENYMGRTCWDKAITEIFHPNRRYFHVDEALRPSFIQGDAVKWQLPKTETRVVITTVGCGTLYKGADMIIKTAWLLKERGVDFCWNLVGHMPNELRMLVEYKEKHTFKDCNIKLTGPLKPKELSEMLCSSTIYAHASYIDNSPNSLCEAQILGTPIVSTNVGGISSLVENGVNGILVPANDPYRMVYEIIKLIGDKERMLEYSKNGQSVALERHNTQKIARDLLSCYTEIIKKK